MSYNTASQQFPTNVIAGMFSFAPANCCRRPKGTKSASQSRAVLIGPRSGRLAPASCADTPGSFVALRSR